MWEAPIIGINNANITLELIFVLSQDEALYGVLKLYGGTGVSDLIWHRVCLLDDLEENWGEVALVEGRQFAIFRLSGDRVFATDHRDPRSGALVIARGITGEKAGVPSLASPLYKEEYSLLTGEQLNGSDYSLGVYPARVDEGEVFIQV